MGGVSVGRVGAGLRWGTGDGGHWGNLVFVPCRIPYMMTNPFFSYARILFSSRSAVTAVEQYSSTYSSSRSPSHRRCYCCFTAVLPYSYSSALVVTRAATTILERSVFFF